MGIFSASLQKLLFCSHLLTVKKFKIYVTNSITLTSSSSSSSSLSAPSLPPVPPPPNQPSGALSYTQSCERRRRYMNRIKLRSQRSSNSYFYNIRSKPNSILTLFLASLQVEWVNHCHWCRGDWNYIQSQAFGGLSWPAHVLGAPHGTEFHRPCTPCKEQ